MSYLKPKISPKKWSALMRTAHMCIMHAHCKICLYYIMYIVHINTESSHY